MKSQNTSKEYITSNVSTNAMAITYASASAVVVPLFIKNFEEP